MLLSQNLLNICQELPKFSLSSIFSDNIHSTRRMKLRKRFEVQYELGATPIEHVYIPTKSRDELPPVLRALQYIYMTPELNQKVFKILESKVMSDKKQTGRPGMTLWEILVLATVRLARDADYDHLHYMATSDNVIRGLLGARKYGETKRDYSLQTIKDNIGLIEDETLDEINDVVVEAGHQLVKKKDEGLEVKVDSYVLESTVHFPTDINLLYDAARKSLQLAQRLACLANLSGWRKSQYWRNQFKSHSRLVGKLFYSNSKQKDEKLKQATEAYLRLACQLSQRLDECFANFTVSEKSSQQARKQEALFEQLNYFKGHLDHQIDLINRRMLDGETIPHGEKVFSLFEPYTEWIQRGKAAKRQELGLKMAIAVEQFGFILSRTIMQKQHDKDLAIPIANELLRKYEIASLSFDKNYWTPENFQTLSLRVDNLILPKKGRLKNEEYEREHSKTFLALRKRHSAVESAINCLEHHGLNRCPDRGLSHFKKYSALGVLACNLHKLGNILLEKERILSKNTKPPKAA